MQSNEALEIILEIAKSLKYDPKLNERYLHHYFSSRINNKHNLKGLTENNKEITLHPEWPTWKKETNLEYRKYKKENGFKPNKNGRAGFIDFAIGDYMEPNLGIEFTLNQHGWSSEAIVGDFLKMMDRKNPFKMAISYNVIFRKEKLVKGGNLEKLKASMNNTVKEAIDGLNNDVCNNSRELYLIVTEIDKDNQRRHWHYDRENEKFKDGLPVIA